MKTAAQAPSYTEAPQVLYIGFELGEDKWKLGFATAWNGMTWNRSIPARNLLRLSEEIKKAKKRFGLAAESPVRSCYEAGRDGFWVHRALFEAGIENLVVDSASVEVNRRARRRKTDRLDAKALVNQLIRWFMGDRRVWSVVRVPTPEQEDARQLHRSLVTVKKEKTRLTVRIKGILASAGVRLPVDRSFAQRLDRARNGLGQPLAPGIRQRVELEYERLLGVQEQLKKLESMRRREINHGENPVAVKARKLIALHGIGQNGAWGFSSELFSWREFQNRKQVGSILGLTPTPYQSGDSYREQGIGKDGLRTPRALSIELAWRWLQFQPESKLTRWYEERFANGGPRMRKIGIVAVARKLAIALWHWVEHGVLPEGATLSA